MRDPRYFSRVSGLFQTGTRLNICRYSNDGYSEAPVGRVVELAQNVICDVHGQHVRLHPTQPIIKTKYEAETGLVLHEEGGRQVLRRDGRVIESFKDAQAAQWWLGRTPHDRREGSLMADAIERLEKSRVSTTAACEANGL